MAELASSWWLTVGSRQWAVGRTGSRHQACRRHEALAAVTVFVFSASASLAGALAEVEGCELPTAYCLLPTAYCLSPERLQVKANEAGGGGKRARREEKHSTLRHEGGGPVPLVVMRAV